MGNNSHGFNNEEMISEEFNKEDPNKNMQNFKEYIAKTTSSEKDKLKAQVVSSNSYKADVLVTAKDKEIGISIKQGSSNSVHQEKVSNFIKYVRNNDNIEGVTEEISEYFKWFINSKDNATTLKKEYPERLRVLKNFLDKNQFLLAKRFVKKGDNDEKAAEIIYYGTEEEGEWALSNYAIREALSRNNKRATLPLGSLTLQAWNRTNESKRYTLQVKWGKIEEDVKKANNHSDSV